MQPRSVFTAYIRIFLTHYEKMPYLSRVDTEAKQVSLKPAGSPVAVCSRPLQTKSEPIPCREVYFGFGLGAKLLYSIYTRACAYARNCIELKGSAKTRAKPQI